MKDSFDVKEWIRFAQMDYDVAAKMANDFCPAPIEIVCYHCQQSAEKVLKAYIIAQSETLVKTHDLKFLLDKCTVYNERFDDFAHACFILASYATLTRYPASENEITERDMRTSLQNANDILEFTKARLAELGY